MNRLIRILCLTMITIIMFSCATMSPRQKLLVGKWKPVKIENANIPEHKTTLARLGAADSLKPTPVEAKKDSGAVAVTHQAEKLNRLIQTEMRSTMQLNADKTGIRFYHGKDINLTWKLKKQGTILSARNPESGRKIDLQIIRVNDSIATVIQKAPEGNLRITLRKEK